MSDNFHFDLTGVSLETCFDVAFGKSRKMVGWYVEPPGGGAANRSYISVQNALVAAGLSEPIPDEETKRLRGKTDLGRQANTVMSHLRQEGWELRRVAVRDPSVPRMVLFWSDFDGKDVMQKLPAPMGAEEAVPFVKSWLSSVNYGHEPDHDGDNGKGWRVYNESWTHIGRWHSSFAAIEPVWLMYGK